jgi:hypothetical protein
MDGYGSHLTYKLWEYARANNILMFKLPPHSTHLTQPLDVGVFQPMKQHHVDAVHTAVRLGDAEFSRLEFLAAFRDFKFKAFKPTTIQSAGKKVGLIPYNPEIVLSKIRAMNPMDAPSRYIPWSSPTSPPPGYFIPPCTPKKPEDVLDQGKLIAQRLENGEEISPHRLQAV